jgi:hypothetical protein
LTGASSSGSSKNISDSIMDTGGNDSGVSASNGNPSHPTLEPDFSGLYLIWEIIAHSNASTGKKLTVGLHSLLLLDRSYLEFGVLPYS